MISIGSDLGDADERLETEDRVGDAEGNAGVSGDSEGNGEPPLVLEPLLLCGRLA